MSKAPAAARMKLRIKKLPCDYKSAGRDARLSWRGTSKALLWPRRIEGCSKLYPARSILEFKARFKSLAKTQYSFKNRRMPLTCPGRLGVGCPPNQFFREIISPGSLNIFLNRRRVPYGSIAGTLFIRQERVNRIGADCAAPRSAWVNKG